jgi:hypothetical protein
MLVCIAVVVALAGVMATSVPRRAQGRSRLTPASVLTPDQRVRAGVLRAVQIEVVRLSARAADSLRD